jgi:hypothetical protein
MRRLRHRGELAHVSQRSRLTLQAFDDRASGATRRAISGNQLISGESPYLSVASAHILRPRLNPIGVGQ